MSSNKNPKLVHNSQSLRRNMTKEERHLWYDFLKELPITFNRQKVIGKYIVDFYCSEYKLVIELDGSQHFEDGGKIKDAERDNYLHNFGIQVARYSNKDINQHFDRVCNDILLKLKREI